MAETFVVNDQLEKEEKYKLLFKQLESLLNKNERLITNLSNFTAALKQTFSLISWVGFYLYDGEILYLGPFQGKVACTEIKMGTGVCGTAAMNQHTVIVPDVDKFPGHIACDPDSKSEIVVPIIKNNKLIGVLDLDSNKLNSFNEIDKIHLEKIVDFFSNEII